MVTQSTMGDLSWTQLERELVKWRWKEGGCAERSSNLKCWLSNLHWSHLLLWTLEPEMPGTISHCRPLETDRIFGRVQQWFCRASTGLLLFDYIISRFLFYLIYFLLPNKQLARNRAIEVSVWVAALMDRGKASQWLPLSLSFSSIACSLCPEHCRFVWCIHATITCFII